MMLARFRTTASGSRSRAYGCKRSVQARFHYVDRRRNPLLHARAERAVPPDLCVEPAAEGRSELQYRAGGKGVPIPVRRRLNFLDKRGSFQMTRFSVAAAFSVMVLGASAFAQAPPPASAVAAAAGALENGVPRSAAHRGRVERGQGGQRQGAGADAEEVRRAAGEDQGAAEQPAEDCSRAAPC